MYISSPRSSQAANAGRQVCQENRGIPKSGTGEDMPRKPLDRRRAGRTGIQFPQPFVTVNCECLQLSPFWRFNFLHFCLQLFPKSTCKKQDKGAQVPTCREASPTENPSLRRSPNRPLRQVVGHRAFNPARWLQIPQGPKLPCRYSTHPGLHARAERAWGIARGSTKMV